MDMFALFVFICSSQQVCVMEYKGLYPDKRACYMELRKIAQRAQDPELDFSGVCLPDSSITPMDMEY
jgi:hypothetical protein